MRGRCMRGRDRKLCFSKKERGKVWKVYMKGIINEEHDWHHNVEGDAVEDPVVCVDLLWSPSITDDDDFFFNVEDTTRRGRIHVLKKFKVRRRCTVPSPLT